MTKTNDIKNWLAASKPRAIAVGLAALLAVGGIGAGGVYAYQNAQNTQTTHATGNAPTKRATTAAEKAQVKEKKNTKATAGIALDAPDWDGTTVAIVHLEGADEVTAGTDVYHAVTQADVANKKAAIEVVPGTYKISWISPVNADGSVYKTGTTEDGKLSLKPENAAGTLIDVPEGDTTTKPVIAGTLEKVGADSVTDADLADLVAAVTQAATKGDDTLKGDAGKAVIDTVTTSVNAHPHKGEATDAATTQANAAKEQATSGEAVKATDQVKNDNAKPVETPKGHWEERPVYTTVPVYEDQPIYEDRPVYGEKPIYEERPVYEWKDNWITKTVSWTVYFDDGGTIELNANRDNEQQLVMDYMRTHGPQGWYVLPNESTVNEPQQVQVGTEQVQVGTETVQTGTEKVQVGTKKVQTGTKQVQTGTTKVWVEN